MWFKQIYVQLNLKQPDYTVKIQKWSRDLAEQISQKLWITEVNRIYVTTNIPKLRSFQYRLMHRALVTNINLYRWGMSTNNVCTLCSKECETITHLFVECECVTPIWLHIECFLANSVGVNIKLTSRDKLWGCILSKKRQVVNFILLAVRQYIYRQRCLRKDLSFTSLKSEILTLKNIEKYIAIKNNKEKQYTRKWGEPCKN